MAYTATLVRNDVHGSQRAISYDVTADAQSGSVSTGLSFIESIQWSPVSMATASLVKVRPNISEASAAANGTVMISGAASGDRLFMTVFGR